MSDKRSRLQPRFDAIEKAGGIKLPNMKRGSGVSFTGMERHKATFSFWAFLFTIFYYGYHGVWKKGIVLLAIGFAIVIVCDIAVDMFIPSFYDSWSSASNMLVPILFALSAPRNLYSKYVLNENGWNPF
jgi:hypothetical protein